MPITYLETLMDHVVERLLREMRERELHAEEELEKHRQATVEREAGLAAGRRWAEYTATREQLEEVARMKEVPHRFPSFGGRNLEQWCPELSQKCDIYTAAFLDGAYQVWLEVRDRIWNQAVAEAEQDPFYLTFWTDQGLTAEAGTLEEMSAALRAAADELDKMREAGVEMDTGDWVEDGYVALTTTDPVVARQFHFDLVE
jgi:hypothetical protein